MQWALFGVILLLVFVIYRIVMPRMGRGREFDAGSVSEQWIAQHRAYSEDLNR
jgi:hypothetical protein